MQNNWVVREAEKTDKSKDFVILENPDRKDYVDDLLIDKFWPVIRNKLKNTHYNYGPKKNPKTDFELSYELARSLTFMLFDGRKAFFRGKLSCSVNGWMLESEFFLGLSKETNPLIIFEILGNSRFRGMPPLLGVDKNKHNDYFQITFRNGSGAGWAVYNDQYIHDKIREVIDVNTKLYEFTKDGCISDEEIGEFLSLAYSVYEAY